jgi:hypothetical protein
VRLLSVYGTTETGGLMASTRDFNADKDWNWVGPSAISKAYLQFEDRGSGVLECVVLDGYPPKVNWFF